MPVGGEREERIMDSLHRAYWGHLIDEDTKDVKNLDREPRARLSPRSHASISTALICSKERDPQRGLERK